MRRSIHEIGMPTRHTLSAIVLPALLGILVSAFVATRIFEHYRAPAGEVRAAPAGSTLPRAPLANLNTWHDEYQNVTKGKVLLVFITTDCDACRKELVNASHAAPCLASRVNVYGIGIEEPDTVKKFAEVNHIDLPMLWDHGAVMLRQLGFRLMPTKVLLQDGVILKIWHGSSADNNALLRDIREVGTR